jgi:hypothetical protein
VRLRHAAASLSATAEPDARVRAGDSNERGAMFEFSQRDLQDRNYSPEVGDEVEFSVFLDKRSRKRAATRISVVRLNRKDKHQGL